MIFYIAGPMRGIRYYNFGAFDDMADEIYNIHGDDSVVLNPAQMDRDVGFDAYQLPGDYDWDSIPDGFDFDACVERDIEAVKKCDAIYMLDGWRESSGARAELALAEWLGKDAYYQTPFVLGEVRVVNDKTGGEKGSKLCRMDLIPAQPLMELGEHFGRGSEKYEDRNWERGYDWSLSYAACMRHLWQFWGGEDTDKETGSKHVIAAAWHCLALAEFMEKQPEMDDRAK